jgi:hypothetical protein
MAMLISRCDYVAEQLSAVRAATAIVVGVALVFSGTTFAIIFQSWTWGDKPAT